MKKSALLIGLSVFAVAGNNSARAALSESDLTELLHESGAKVQATNITVVGSGPIITVMADEDQKAKDQDLRIDAVFLSKVLVDAAASQITSVKVLFSQGDKPGRFLIIPKKELVEYGSGKLSAPQLLSSLHFNDVNQEQGPKVTPGLDFERRLLVWKRINKLKQAGTGTAPFEALFQGTENLVKLNDAANLDAKLTYLEGKLSEQERQVAEVKSTARYHAAATPGSVSTAGGYSSRGEQNQGGNYQGGLNERIPPDAEILKSLYLADGENVIRQVDSKNHDAAQSMRALKPRIDKGFADNNLGTAFILLHRFQETARQATGVDPFGPPDGGPGSRGGGPGMNSGGPRMNGGGPGMNNGGPGMNGGGPGMNGGGPGMNNGGPGVNNGGPRMNGGGPWMNGGGPGMNGGGPGMNGGGPGSNFGP